jgi:hypothetical protein
MEIRDVRPGRQDDRRNRRIRFRIRDVRGLLGRRGVGCGRIHGRTVLDGGRRHVRLGFEAIRDRIVGRRDGWGLDRGRDLGRRLSLAHGVGPDVLARTDADPGDGS